MKFYLLLISVCFNIIVFAQQQVSTNRENADRVGADFENFSYRSNSPVVTFEAQTIDQVDSLIQNLFIGGCVDVTNITYTGAYRAVGTIHDTSSTLGIPGGIALTTGRVNNIAGPNLFYNRSTNNSLPGDSLLTALAGIQSLDAAIIEFDFIPNADTIFISDFVLGSEEYPEYVGLFNDIFGFFISGPSIDSFINVAIVPGTNLPVSINNLNNGYGQTQSSGPCTNCEYYWENYQGTLYEYDGFSTPIHVEYPVISGETYHFKLAIADVLDRIYDTGIIIKSNTFCGDSWFQKAEFEAHTQDGVTYNFRNLSQHADQYIWDFGDGTFSTEAEPVHSYPVVNEYTVSLTASNSCFDTTTTHPLNMVVTGYSNINSLIPVFDVQKTNNEGIYKVVFQPEKAEEIIVSICDMTGRTVFIKNYGVVHSIIETLDLSFLEFGIYGVTATINETQFTKKILR